MSDAETRLHFRIGYLGAAFHGSQIQQVTGTMDVAADMDEAPRTIF